MIAEYLEHALQFERMSGETADPKLRDAFSSQARAYRNSPPSAPSGKGCLCRQIQLLLDRQGGSASQARWRPDSRDTPLQPMPRDMYVPGLHINTLMLKARNFR